MALTLCSSCERHVRASDPSCPYCGATERSLVPAPAKVSSRAVLFASAVVAVAAVEAACSTTVALYGAPGEPWVEPPPSDASLLPDGRPPSPPGQDSGAACFSNLGASVKGTLPSPRRGLCDPQEIGEVETQCLTSPHGGTACKAWKEAHQTCARCIFGPLDGEGPESAPAGAVIPSGATTVMTNLGACASLVLGRLDCAVPIAKASACTAGSCTACMTGSSKRACETFAESACVGPKEAECDKALKDDYALWASTCQGATPGATFAKVATYLCGAPPADAGSD